MFFSFQILVLKRLQCLYTILKFGAFQAARQQLERLPRRQTQGIGSVNSGGGSSAGHTTTMAAVLANNTVTSNNVSSNSNSVSFCTTSSNLQNFTFLIPR